MIRIIKGAAPAVLVKNAAAGHQQLVAAVKAKAKLKFRKSLYAAKSVRDSLMKAQNGKCAFCESHFAHVGYGDVEHFRPKAGVRQATGDKLKRPGYYWLAYSWDNLFVSCQLCNQKFKGNLFPLRNPKARCLRPSHPLSRERPLLVHPEDDNPTAFVTFHGETAVPKFGGAAPRGRATIATFGLNRDELRAKRMEVLRRLRDMKFICDSLEARIQRCATPDPEDQRHLAILSQLLSEAQQPTAEYSAMACALLR